MGHHDNPLGEYDASPRESPLRVVLFRMPPVGSNHHRCPISIHLNPPHPQIRVSLKVCHLYVSFFFSFSILFIPTPERNSNNSKIHTAYIILLFNASLLLNLSVLYFILFFNASDIEPLSP